MEVAGPFRVLAHQLWIKPQKRDLLVTGEAIVPEGVQAGSSDPNANVANLIGQRGMADWDRDGRDEHSNAPSDMWLSAKGQTQTWLEFDLGEARKLATICIWNFNDTWYTNRGVRKADVSVWTQETGWRKLHDDLSLAQAEGGNDYDEPVVVSLDNVTAQKIRLDDLAGFGDAEHVGLSKVQFFKPHGPQAVRPYPPDGADIGGIGGIELGWVAGENAQAHNVCLGGDPDDLKLIGKVDQAGARLSGLNDACKYYWRIDEVQTDGSAVPSRVWNFTTGALAAWWKLDEAEGTRVADSSGNGHDGAIHGEPTWQPAGGHVGGALQFDGVDDYVDTGWADDLPAWTVAAWIRSPAAPTAPTACGPIHRENNFQINWDHGNDEFRGAAGLRVAGTWYSAGFGELGADTWYHLVATFNGENLRTYKDGVLITDKAIPLGSPDAESNNLMLGKHAIAEAYFAGTIDDVSIFSYALRTEEIKVLYAGEKPADIVTPPAVADVKLERPSPGATGPGLVAWWRLDESEGIEVPDASGHNHTGALRGDARWQPSAGKLAGAIELDGDGDFIHIGSDSVFDFANEMTVAAWIKVNQFDKSWQSIVTKGDSAWRIARDGGENGVQFAAGLYMENMQMVRSTTRVNDGNWHYVAGVCDGQKMCLYVDGRLDASADVSGEIPTNQYPVLVGENAERPGRGWNGLIDDVQLYNQALTEERIAALYAGQEPEIVVATTPPVKIQTVASEAPPAGAPDGGNRNWIAMTIMVLVIAGAAGWAMFGKKSSA